MWRERKEKQRKKEGNRWGLALAKISGGFGERGRIRNIGQRLWGIYGIGEKGRQKENSMVMYRGPVTETTRPGQTQWLSAYICYLTTGGPGKERRTNKLPPTRRILGKGQKEWGDTSPSIPPASQIPPRWNPSWQSGAWVARKDPEPEVIGQRQPGK